MFFYLGVTLSIITCNKKRKLKHRMV